MKYILRAVAIVLITPFLIIGFSIDFLWHFKFAKDEFVDEIENYIHFIKTGEII